jgi:hypothetical protein
MARRLQSISSLALNNINLDSESDYDTDELESTRLHLNEDGTVGDISRPVRPTFLPDLDIDSSDAESLAQSSEGTGRQKVLRRKKRATGKRDLDMDKTPTQDSVNGSFFNGESGQMSASFSEFGGRREVADVQLTNGATSSETNSATLSQSVTGSLPADDPL